MPQANQIDRKRDEVRVTADDLLRVPEGPISENGIRQNINVGVLYLEAWLGGLGCVPLYNLMEDAATAEISRTQLWQWIRHGVSLDEGPRVMTNVEGVEFEALEIGMPLMVDFRSLDDDISIPIFRPAIP